MATQTDMIKPDDLTDVDLVPDAEATRPQGFVPYTIGSVDWALTSADEPAGLSLQDMAGEDSVHRLDSVLKVFSKVYALAKVAYITFRNYALLVTEEDFDILRHLQKAESLVTTYAIQELVNVTDQLYHALYARITLEIAHTHLCSEFPLERTRTPSIDFFFMLPEAHHLCRIFRAFKEIMDCPSVCSVLNRELVNKHQADILLKAIDYVDVHGFSLDDMLGYRAFMRNYLRPRHNPFYSKYGRFRQIYTMPPVKVLIFASEKFLSISPRDMVKDDMPSSELPFINVKSLNPRYWEKEIMLDHRLAALAKLEGKAIGQLRREQHDAGDPLVEFAQERKCICPAVCCCAIDCTNDVEHACPCAERMLRIELAKRSREVSSQVFGARCANFARLIFETLAYIDRDVDGCDIFQEILSSIELIEQEVDKERRQRVQAALACSSESE